MSNTPIPTLFYGGRDADANLLQANEGISDNGAAIVLLTKSAALAPAGAAGECIFRNVYLTVTHTMGTTLTLTPVIDFVPITAESVDVVLTAQGSRLTQRFEIGLSVSHNSGAFRTAMRGAWFQLQIQTPPSGLAAGDLILDQVELDYEVVRETVAAEN